ncbi:unnamed protein product [Didymodactylos carnosus]|uniref:Cellulase n=1 Tax=Didymodactylos carnosus TaxID=1234261 RepID=A0A814PUH9_9BILA|nr:unnamed protein product [Didymodactylos carnosus]CAF1110618.1 unnamed protein product [Didymodactylos carnosus]CAF3687335.1 unnamed protein product [Didymodactylos carnosus]CAF3875029.1 unnamed protein product [Didymodactylos carnosus]
MQRPSKHEFFFSMCCHIRALLHPYRAHQELQLKKVQLLLPPANQVQPLLPQANRPLQYIPVLQSTASLSSSLSATTKAGTTPGSMNDGRADGVTTRYWDCCKASCAWSGKASVINPVQTCEADGVTVVDVDEQSGCGGGKAYVCNNQQPWNISTQLSYGFAAAHIARQDESNWCCACYSLVFTSGVIIGKELIVQVTNTGGDLGDNQFDLQMPGGGVGIFNGCTSQFPSTPTSAWGEQYGGVTQRSQCAQLPNVLQSGCYWRFDWFQNANNPMMRFKQVTCPDVLISKTQCKRQ